MNNLTFGDATMGYYETIAGGAGAGPSWHGCSAVHTHMTNTRITDPEILERRYPVILRQFSVRKGSGGDGAYRGGDGVVRELEFTKVINGKCIINMKFFHCCIRVFVHVLLTFFCSFILYDGFLSSLFILFVVH